MERTYIHTYPKKRLKDRVREKIESSEHGCIDDNDNNTRKSYDWRNKNKYAKRDECQKRNGMEWRKRARKRTTEKKTMRIYIANICPKFNLHNKMEWNHSSHKFIVVSLEWHAISKRWNIKLKHLFLCSIYDTQPAEYFFLTSIYDSGFSCDTRFIHGMWMCSCNSFGSFWLCFFSCLVFFFRRIWLWQGGRAVCSISYFGIDASIHTLRWRCEEIAYFYVMNWFSHIHFFSSLPFFGSSRRVCTQNHAFQFWNTAFHV